MKCRFCTHPVEQSFANLGLTPLSNSFVARDQLSEGEYYYPLHAYVCENCFLVQLDQFEAPQEIFKDYAYFSSFSTSWLSHAEAYCNQIATALSLNACSRVVEVASNDGYLLQYFRDMGIRVLGVEPAENVAAVAIDKGIPTICEFLGEATARAIVDRYGAADLVVANNVLAHVPDINDFVSGLKALLAMDGTLSVEFPSLMNLLQYNQFDTIYHEHFSYLSLTTVNNIFAEHGLTVYHVEKVATHGGSLRVYGACAGSARTVPSASVSAELKREHEFGLTKMETYKSFQEKIYAAKNALLRFLIEERAKGSRIAAYGAPAKGNTLLNYCGVGTDFVDFTVDRNPVKQGTWLPGSRIPVYGPEMIFGSRPDFVLVLPWNIFDEIRGQLQGISKWGGHFVRAIPALEVV